MVWLRTRNIHYFISLALQLQAWCEGLEITYLFACFIYLFQQYYLLKAHRVGVGQRPKPKTVTAPFPLGTGGGGVMSVR